MVLAGEIRTTESARGGRRTSRPKVKTGCLTCKQRRVKCDEGRPECLRCQQIGKKCGGYHLKSTLQPIPATRQEMHRCLGLITEQYQDTILPDPYHPRFQTQWEHHFFQHFATKIAPHLSGWLDHVLWNQIVPQASEVEESIRHAAISIGASSMLKLPSNSLTGPGKSTEEEARQHVFALEQYGKAIKHLRLSPPEDVRTALIASILIICFERLQGNHVAAARQTRTAVRLVESRDRTPRSKTDIEEDLVCMIDRLQFESMAMEGPNTDLFSPEEHLALKRSDAALMTALPTAFQDIPTARNHLYTLRRRWGHFIFLTKIKHQAAIKDLTQQQLLSYTPEESLVLEKFKGVSELETWLQAFQPLYNKHRMPDERRLRTHGFLAVTLLRMHYLLRMVTMDNLFDTSELGFDKSVSVFQEIVHLCEDLHSGKGNLGEKVFVLEMQCLLPLTHIARSCRDPVIRRKAVAMLRQRPVREGILDSLFSAKVAEWVINVEEEGMVDGYISVEHRVRGLNVQLSDGFEVLAEEYKLRGVSINLEKDGRGAKVGCWVGPTNAKRREGIIEL